MHSKSWRFNHGLNLNHAEPGSRPILFVQNKKVSLTPYYSIQVTKIGYAFLSFFYQRILTLFNWRKENQCLNSSPPRCGYLLFSFMILVHAPSQHLYNRTIYTLKSELDASHRTNVGVMKCSFIRAVFLTAKLFYAWAVQLSIPNKTPAIARDWSTVLHV